MANSVVTRAKDDQLTIGSPKSEYTSSQGEWLKNRAVIQGQSYVKDYDGRPSVTENLLLPFNASMTQAQYDQYKAEAELPGVSSQYAKMLTGGLLRKTPMLEITDNRLESEEMKDWLLNRFGKGNESMISFLDAALWEEMQTSRAWVQIDYPVVDLNNLSPEDRKKVCPFPVLWKAESIINWSTDINPITGETRLNTLITRFYAREASVANPYHPNFVDTVQIHKLDNEGLYFIETYTNTNSEDITTFIDGQVLQNYSSVNQDEWTLQSTNTNILIDGERIDFIPFVPLNGSIDIVDPSFTPIVDREVALYNKVSRRNHLLYLSATYTPVVSSDTLSEGDKTALARQGLGTWMFVGKEDKIQTLATPTHSLTDMETAIKGAYDELTRIGVKMLSLEPANADSSGVALQIRNAAQNAQIATLNAKVSDSIKKIILIMLRWKTGLVIPAGEVRYNLSSDFNKLTTSTETIRLISEWYQSGIIPRPLFVEIMKNNDVLPSDYEDASAVNEINADELVMSPRAQIESEQESITATNEANNAINANPDNNQ